MTDRELQGEIRANLNSDPAVNLTQIGAAVVDGVVSPSGYVHNQDEKLAVEKAVVSLDGVNAWVEEIEVRSSGSNPDLEIAGRARETIARHLGRKRERIKIEVEHGQITLGGHVEREYEKIAAETFLRKIAGVKGNTSQIEVAPPPAGLAETARGHDHE